MVSMSSNGVSEEEVAASNGDIGNDSAPLDGKNDVLCLLWVGTSGQGGHLLGTDEADVAYIKYVIYHTTKKQIVTEEHHVIRPPPPLNNQKHKEEENGQEERKDKHVHENCVRDYQLNESKIAEGESIESVFEKIEETFNRVASCLDSNTPYTNNNNHYSQYQTNTDSANRPVFVTDGQYHLRQVLHPKMAFNNISLPSDYCKFYDLRKIFKQFYNTSELTSVTDMANYLEFQMSTDENLAERSTKTMVDIIGRLIDDGHVFRNAEVIDIKLLPGIVVKGDEVDSSCVVRARGLPWMSTDVEIARFFRGLNLAKGGVALCLSPQGRRNGEALIRFIDTEQREMALKRHKHHMGGRYIEVYKATGEDFISIATGNNNEASQFLSRGNVILRMRGLPYDCTAKQVVDFFEGGEVGVSLVEQEDGVLFVRKPDGRATGDAFVMLASEEDIALAMSKHKLSIGTRYIELFRSSSGEVMNRAMDLRHMEQQQQQQQGPPALPQGPPSLPLIATLPHMTQQLMPQASVATGPKKNCIRLRGLPYEAQIEHVLEFLGDFSNSICFRGVHMVYTTQLSNETCYQSHPSGEAFIQMVSEHAAYTTAAHRHNKYMVFGKKNRYIEVFQCSNDDMNFVLSGMAPSSPQTPTAPPVNARSLVPTPGGMLVWDNGAPHIQGAAPGSAAPLILPQTRLQTPLHLPPPSSPIRPPFGGGLTAMPQAFLTPPPTNGMPFLSPLKPPQHMILPSNLASLPGRANLDGSATSPVSLMSAIKTTPVSSYPSNFFATSYLPPTSVAANPHSPQNAAGMFLFPNLKANSSLASPVLPQFPFLQNMTTPVSDPSKTNQVLYSYAQNSSYTVGQRTVTETSAAASSSTKRSFDQAFTSEGSGSSNSSTSPGGPPPAKRISSSTSPVLPQQMPVAANTFPPHATFPTGLPFNAPFGAGALGAPPMGLGAAQIHSHMIPSLYPPTMYPTL